MTRTEYLTQLERYLKRLPKEDYEEAMDYFIEYFDEAGPENVAQVIEELGSPKEAASDILYQLLDDKMDEQVTSPKKHLSLLWITLLAVLASPVAIPLFLILSAAIITVIAIFFAAFITLLGILFAGGVLGASIIYSGLTSLATSFSGGLLGIGLGLIIISCAIIVIFLGYLIFEWFVRLLFRFIKWMIQKGRKS
ncbi:DUF1700 domain-containing protein [Streptococcus saliviloxodontae]|uniref:Membrane protein n=1 Tax=Streptococcus saliviloxodontae TaxID=1349416 RepID=A0ABS2PKT4_9STRE|nr:DUF1700 domain-containing protein [Streptococcus saliviloxodontae]MBM7636045.1 putative membrane protein [Streptococcus saliviloxodontae]